MTHNNPTDLGPEMIDKVEQNFLTAVGYKHNADQMTAANENVHY